MSKAKPIKGFWIGMMAGVFLWLAVGALINFHQYHVYGKIYAFQLHAALSFKKDDRTSTYYPQLESFSPAIAQWFDNSFLLPCPYAKSIFDEWHVFSLISLLEGIQPPRAPPLSIA